MYNCIFNHMKHAEKLISKLKNNLYFFSLDSKKCYFYLYLDNKNTYLILWLNGDFFNYFNCVSVYDF